MPRLGSPQDKVLRQYLSIEADQKAAEMQLMMLNTMMTPSFTDQGKADTWTQQVRKAWTNLLSKLYHVEVAEETRTDLEMLDYYEKYVKTIKPKIRRADKGKGLVVEGFEGLKKILALENFRAKLKNDQKPKK